VPQLALDPIADMGTNGRVDQLFATPVFWYVVPGAEELNAELRALILEAERTTPAAVKSNQGGWQSPTDVFAWDAPAVETLHRLASRAVEVATARLALPDGIALESHISGWAAVNRRGHYNTVHVHPQATWSGIYYVDPGDEPPDTLGGALELAHPSVASVMTFFPNLLPSARVVRPQAGLLILFPSHLQHSVRLYGGERPRVCVPFNAHLRVAARAEPAHS
jgi:uncharacterized protein (TIGR02466 family)